MITSTLKNHYASIQISSGSYNDVQRIALVMKGTLLKTHNDERGQEPAFLNESFRREQRFVGGGEEFDLHERLNDNKFA